MWNIDFVEKNLCSKVSGFASPVLRRSGYIKLEKFFLWFDTAYHECGVFINCILSNNMCSLVLLTITSIYFLIRIHYFCPKFRDVRYDKIFPFQRVQSDKCFRKMLTETFVNAKILFSLGHAVVVPSNIRHLVLH